MPKNFFKSESERNLWIKLNAERIRYANKVTNRIDEEDLGDVEKQYSPMWISRNQLVYDENEREELRFSFEEFLTLTPQELYRLSDERNRINIRNLFKEFFENSEDNL